MKSCCLTKRGKCKRKTDNKVFTMPRKFSRAKCRNPRGFTMRASCAHTVGVVEHYYQN